MEGYLEVLVCMIFIILMSTFQQEYHPEHHKQQYSTAEKFFDIEESQRRYQELVEENIWLKQQIGRSRIQEGSLCQQYRNCPDCSGGVGQGHQGQSDQVLWGMLERNKYLEDKIDKLRGQFEKQSRTISAIRGSDKWKSRFVCSPQSNSCYEDKYLQILRVRSPFY